MIHPSTMAGPNWFTGSFGTTNPFQQNTSFFRNTPFGGQQGGFGPGINPFQSQPMGFGTTTMQLQNTINEIVRQTVPTILANCGIQPNNMQGTFGFQTGINPGQIGFSTPFGFQTPTGPAQFGPQFQSSTWTSPSPFVTDYQTQIQNQIQQQAYVAEMIRQATQQAIQSLTQQIPGILTQGLSWQGTTSQPYSGIGTMAFTGPQNAFTTHQQQQQNLWNLINQVTQAVTQCVLASLTQQNQTQNTPYNLNIGSPQSSVTPGIPTGAGVF
jgi:hypothetical protein